MQQILEKIKDYLGFEFIEVKENIQDQLKSKRNLIIIYAAYGILMLNTSRMVLQCLSMFFWLDFYNVNILNAFSLITNLILCFLPFIVWTISTMEDAFYYHNKKLMLFYYCILNVMVIFSRYVMTVSEAFIVPIIFKYEPGKAITVGMLEWAARIIIGIIMILFWCLVCLNSFEYIRSDETTLAIIKFKITQVFDFRKNKENLYDQNIIEDSDTGRHISYLYEERFMHQSIVGASGTGKTSAAILRIIWEDLVKKKNNQIKRYKEYQEMLENGEAFLAAEDIDNPDRIQPFPGYEQKVIDIKKKYPDCGYTCINPDSDLTDKVAKYCKMLGFDYDLCDSEKINGKHKDNFRGINPYHIPDDVDPNDIPEEIATRSTLIADVLQSVFEESGTTNIYFTGVNKRFTTSVSTILMVGMPLVDHREPLLTDLLKVLNRFDRVKPYYEAVKSKYGTDESSPYYNVVDFIEVSMLGSAKTIEKNYNECNGLRNIIELLTSVPSVEEMICSRNPIDFKKVLDDGKISLLNYRLSKGKTVAKGVGLLYVMSFHNEVKRRDIYSYLMPHFEIVDEFATLVHPCWEEPITIFRKYRVALTFAFQSMSQFSKNDTTKYLANITMGVGQLMLFGRTDGLTSEEYSKMAGKEKKNVMQETVNTNSIFSDNPTYGESVRSNPTREDYLDASDLSNTDFLEVHVFTVINGRTYPPIKGKLSFLTDLEIKKIPNEHIDFSPFIEMSDTILTNSPTIYYEDEDTKFTYSEETQDDNYEEDVVSSTYR